MCVFVVQWKIDARLLQGSNSPALKREYNYYFFIFKVNVCSVLFFTCTQNWSFPLLEPQIYQVEQTLNPAFTLIFPSSPNEYQESDLNLRLIFFSSKFRSPDLIRDYNLLSYWGIFFFFFFKLGLNLML